MIRKSNMTHEQRQVATNKSRSYIDCMGNTSNLLKWLLLAILLTMCGCGPLRAADDSNPLKPSSSSTSLRSVVDHAQNGLEDVERDAKRILDNSSVAQEQLNPVYEQVDPIHKPAIDEALDSLKLIDSKAENIIEASDDIHNEMALLDNLARQVDRLEDRLLALSSAVDAAKGKAMEKLYGYITMFWVIGFAMIAAGAAVAFFFNKTYGGATSLLGILMIGFASASQYYMEQIALIGAILLAVGLLGGVGAMCWQYVKSQRSDEAMKEIVEMIEILRETMTEDERTRIFGPEGLANKVQSDLTKRIVAEIRQRNGFQKLKQIREEPPKEVQ